MRGKNDDNIQVINKLVRGLSREIMLALDTRKENTVDVSIF